MFLPGPRLLSFCCHSTGMPLNSLTNCSVRSVERLSDTITRSGRSVCRATDSAASWRSVERGAWSVEGNDERIYAGGALKTAGQFGAGNVCLGLKPQKQTVTEEKWSQLFEAERGAEPRVVAQARVRVQRQV